MAGLMLPALARGVVIPVPEGCLALSGINNKALYKQLEIKNDR